MMSRFWHLLLGSYCLLCRAPVTGAEGHRQLCRWCLAALPWRAAPELDFALPGIARVHAPLSYEGATRQWVLGAKHDGGLVAARTLGVLLAESLLDAYPFPADRPELLIPVPLSARRLRVRGHNQAVLVAQQIAAAMNIQLLRTCARRTRHTAMLADLDAQARHAQVAGGFTVSGLPPRCRVAIVDDVVTTGATSTALADALHAAGAAEVHLWAATSAPHPS